mmetsp:Transcript_26652/g.39427  ORF Transcript_26652/g.39427 Transcript_26652/m.39427 type:complete len:86 (+) Transcript_26652:578-835(+)
MHFESSYTPARFYYSITLSKYPRTYIAPGPPNQSVCYLDEDGGIFRMGYEEVAVKNTNMDGFKRFLISLFFHRFIHKHDQILHCD